MAHSVSKRLTRLRKITGLSQPQIAAQVGVNQSTVSRWESGAATPVGLYLASLERLFAEHGVKA